jgi:hypothetical protein
LNPVVIALGLAWAVKKLIQVANEAERSDDSSDSGPADDSDDGDDDPDPDPPPPARRPRPRRQTQPQPRVPARAPAAPQTTTAAVKLAARALQRAGYPSPEAHAAARSAARGLGPNASLQELVTAALQAALPR